jgi:hypothetical protein
MLTAFHMITISRAFNHLNVLEVVFISYLTIIFILVCRFFYITFELCISSILAQLVFSLRC